MRSERLDAFDGRRMNEEGRWRWREGDRYVIEENLKSSRGGAGSEGS